jgi:hypothetical protein
VGSMRWRSTEVVWARTKTAPGACGNGHGHERERKDVRARAANGTRTAREHGRKREGADNMRAPTSTACADARARTACWCQRPLDAWTGERGRQGVRPTGAFARTSVKSCDHLQQSYTIQCISQNLIYHILWFKITALHMEVARKFYL